MYIEDIKWLSKEELAKINPADIFPPEFCTRCEQFSNDGCWHEWSPWWQPFQSGPAPAVFIPVEEKS